MAHVLNVIRGLWLNGKLNQYIATKDEAFRADQNLPSKRKKLLIDNCIYFWAMYIRCGCLKQFFRVNLHKRFVRRMFIFYKEATTYGTITNYIATAICGFLGGLVITFVYFDLISFLFDLSLPLTFYMSVIFCTFLTIGLALSETIRCVTLSVLPELLTRRVRLLLLSFAFMLVVSGPSANILHNTRQLTETITCSRKQLDAVGRNLTAIYLKPLRVVKNTISNMLGRFKPLLDGLIATLESIRDGILAIVEVFKKAESWMTSIGELCKNTGGSPYDFCIQQFRKNYEDCVANTFVLLQFWCNVKGLAENLCSTIKVAGWIVCQFIPFIKTEIVDVIYKKTLELGRTIKSMFYVSVSFHHSFAFQTNETKSVREVISELFHVQEERILRFLSIFGVMKALVAGYIVFVLLNTLWYRERFRRHLYYDNYHINKYIIELDVRRASVKRVTVFPLLMGEKSRYVSLFSLRLTFWEKMAILRDTIFLFASSIKIFYLILIDVSLYFLLMLVRVHGRISFHFGNKEGLVEARGSGIWFQIYNYINRLLKPYEIELSYNSDPCLPEPLEPNFNLYKRVGFILLFSWLTCLFQPFGVRFRNLIMSFYNPEAARRRAVWLYNNILQMRGNFSLFIRRQVWKKVAFGIRTEKPNLRRYLLTRFPRLTLILPYKDMYKECMVCGYTDPKYYCPVPDCSGTYCYDCFAQIGNKCLICSMPANFKGLDVSEEEDSEEEENESKRQTTQKPRSQTQPETISLRGLEEGPHTSLYDIDGLIKEMDRRTDVDRTPKDYFSDYWRKDHWAFLEEFSIPLPNSGSWHRPEYQIEQNEPSQSLT